MSAIHNDDTATSPFLRRRSENRTIVRGDYFCRQWNAYAKKKSKIKKSPVLDNYTSFSSSLSLPRFLPAMAVERDMLQRAIPDAVILVADSLLAWSSSPVPHPYHFRVMIYTAMFQSGWPGPCLFLSHGAPEPTIHIAPLTCVCKSSGGIRQRLL